MHVLVKQHTFKKSRIVFYTRVLLKRNWKLDLENNMLELFEKITKIARMSAQF
jgi:hypothetical protein